MTKFGKGCMPECEYFTTGGCISPFNCLYKIETGYINSATSIPTYMEQYNRMSDDNIERCLERLSTRKATDVMNFDYSATLAYIKRLKAENAALRERLKKSVELPCKVGDKLFVVMPELYGNQIIEALVNQIIFNHGETQILVYYDIHQEGRIHELYESFFGKTVFLTRESAKKRLAELEGETDGYKENKNEENTY